MPLYAAIRFSKVRKKLYVILVKACYNVRRDTLCATQDITSLMKKGQRPKPLTCLFMVTPVGFEPTTPGLGNLCSIP